MRILLMGLVNCTNLGDCVILDCTLYLIKKICNELNITYEIDIFDLEKNTYEWEASYDLLIFSGGGIIKYKYQNFYQMIDSATQVAETKNIPVIFSGIGVEGFSEQDEKCQRLKNALNRSCVKGITTRDDIYTLTHSYIDSSTIFTQKVADPAVWAHEVYNKQKKPSDIIGVGMIREGIYESNDIKIERNDIFQLWSDILMELDRQNQPWRIFTNGYSSDMKFAINLLKYMNREKDISEKIIPSPKTADELVNIISRFKAVIAGRLHANIISYSLDIPSIGIIWNDKLRMWGENIGYPQRFFDVDHFNGKKIVEQALLASEEGYHAINKTEYKATVYQSLKKMVTDVIHLS